MTYHETGHEAMAAALHSSCSSPWPQPCKVYSPAYQYLPQQRDSLCLAGHHTENMPMRAGRGWGWRGGERVGGSTRTGRRRFAPFYAPHCLSVSSSSSLGNMLMVVWFTLAQLTTCIMVPVILSSQHLSALPAMLSNTCISQHFVRRHPDTCYRARIHQHRPSVTSSSRKPWWVTQA